MHPVHGVIEMASITTIVVCLAVAAIIVPAPRQKPASEPATAVAPTAGSAEAQKDSHPPAVHVPAPPPVLSDKERIDALDMSVKQAKKDLEEIKAALRQKAGESGGETRR